MRIKCPSLSLSLCVLELIDFRPTSDHFNFTHHCTCVNTVSLCLFRCSLVFSIFFFFCSCVVFPCGFRSPSIYDLNIYLFSEENIPHVRFPACYITRLLIGRNKKVMKWKGRKLACALSEGNSFLSHHQNMYIFK